jgi:hypothetical protein
VLPVEITRWSISRIFGTSRIFIELHNPNTNVGLLRARYSLAVIGTDGSVVAVFGQAGVPGSIASTIYQMPPGGNYPISEDLPRRAPDVDHLELVIPESQWMDWGSLEAPAVTVLEPGFKKGRYASITGRVNVVTDVDEPFNVFIVSFLEKGDEFVIAYTFVNCIDPNLPYPFQADAFVRSKGYTLGDTFAMTSTIPGSPGSIDGADYPLGCD